MFPGPAHYQLQRYSQFDVESRKVRPQPFAVMTMERSSIREVFPDARCGIPCRPETTRAPAYYAPVPPLDLTRMSMRNGVPSSPGRLRASQCTTLDSVLRSSANLSSTLRDLRASPRGPRAFTAPQI